MNVSSTQDLYNQIKRYIRTHGRLVFGATVLLCLICYLGWRESAWSEVEQLESPIQSHRESQKHLLIHLKKVRKNIGGRNMKKRENP